MTFDTNIDLVISITRFSRPCLFSFVVPYSTFHSENAYSCASAVKTQNILSLSISLASCSNEQFVLRSLAMSLLSERSSTFLETKRLCLENLQRVFLKFKHEQVHDFCHIQVMLVELGCAFKIQII